MRHQHMLYLQGLGLLALLQEITIDSFREIYMLKTKDIHMRDPFVLPVAEQGSITVRNSDLAAGWDLLSV